MNKRELEYPAELEAQFILRIPEEPATTLRSVLQKGESLKNKLTIQIDNDMRHGEVRFDQWLLPGIIVDLPTLIDSFKTIDKKCVYKTADISQMFLCRYEFDPAPIQQEVSNKKDPLKVDKKFLWPHGVTPPMKNVRKRRFRKTLKKKSVETPEIEKEVKRLLRTDNEAVTVSWEVITEAKEHNPMTIKPAPTKPVTTKIKREHNFMVESDSTNHSDSKVEDIFGGTLSDSDLDDNIDLGESPMSFYDKHLSDSDSVQGTEVFKNRYSASQLNSEGFQSPEAEYCNSEVRTSSSSNMTLKGNDKMEWKLQNKRAIVLNMQQLNADLEELKHRKRRTEHEISGIDNMTLRQRFEEILKSISQDITYKEIEYRNLQSLLN